ncbi:MAG: hypothetical protein D6722_04510, partial [Bacteroidetes bacterium]
WRLPGSSGDFAAAERPQVLRLPSGIPLGVAICLDALHGQHARSLVAQGAELLTILTYDGWWLGGNGYRQHASLHSLRAIETRRAVIRLANSGLSFWLDLAGRRHEVLPVGTIATADVRVPLHGGMTFYQQHGDWPGRYALWVSGALLVLLLGLEAWHGGKRSVLAQESPQSPRGRSSPGGRGGQSGNR